MAQLISIDKNPDMEPIYSYRPIVVQNHKNHNLFLFIQICQKLNGGNTSCWLVFVFVNSWQDN